MCYSSDMADLSNSNGEHLMLSSWVVFSILLSLLIINLSGLYSGHKHGWGNITADGTIEPLSKISIISVHVFTVILISSLIYILASNLKGVG